MERVRTATLGAVLLAIASIQFVVAMLVVQVGYPGYSAISNYVSDLGASSAPWAWVFNLGLVVLGTLGLAGLYLLRRELPAVTIGRWGTGAMAVALGAAFLIGFFPEDVGAIHTNLSAVAFLAAAVALILIGLGFSTESGRPAFGRITQSMGWITAAAFVLFVIEPGGRGLQGVWERLIIAPLLLWLVVFAVRCWLLAERPETSALPGGLPGGPRTAT